MNFNDMFQGFQSTPLLWNTDCSVYDLKQFLPNTVSDSYMLNSEYKNLRLGKWIEKFVSFQLQQQTNCKIAYENLQIKKDKLTIGELDLLFSKDHQPIHLEIVYKFYLYDTGSSCSNPLARWIGPNKKDLLIQKLDKLKQKQFPLLFNKYTQKYIDKRVFNLDTVQQYTCFKAQLFLPYHAKVIDINPLNSDCIKGFYISYSDMNLLNDSMFYIPSKLDWLITENHNVEWLNFDEARQQIELLINKNRSPLCWIKTKNIDLHKCFITWW